MVLSSDHLFSTRYGLSRYAGIYFGSSILWPHIEEDNVIGRIPGKELRFVEDYRTGKVLNNTED